MQADRPLDPRERNSSSSDGTRRGTPLRSDPHKPSFAYEDNKYESPAQRRHRHQATFIADRRNAGPPSPGSSAATARRLTSPPPPTTTGGGRSRSRSRSPARDNDYGRRSAPPTLNDRRGNSSSGGNSDGDSRSRSRGKGPEAAVGKSSGAGVGNRPRVDGRDKMRDLEALHRRTLELDGLAKQLEADRARLEKERSEIFSLQQSLLNDALTSPPLPPPPPPSSARPRAVHGLERSVPTACVDVVVVAVGRFG